MVAGAGKSYTFESIGEAEALANWDNIIKAFKWSNLYQSFSWGEIKKEFGWKVCRCVAKEESGEIVGAAQVLLKKKIGFLCAWTPGGPLFINNGLDLRELISYASNVFYRRAYLKYFRIFPMKPFSNEEKKLISVNGWSRPRVPFHGSATVVVNLDRDIDTIRKGLTQKWRYYLKQSENAGHQLEILDKDEELMDFIDLHREMSEAKGFKDKLDFKEINILKKNLGGNLMVFASKEDNLVSSAWMMAIFNDTAYVLRAATSERGRGTFASYFCLWEGMKYLKSMGCKSIEMGGIDPKGNPGVTHFKRGLGGEEVNWIGELEYANSYFARSLISKWIYFTSK